MKTDTFWDWVQILADELWKRLQNDYQCTLQLWNRLKKTSKPDDMRRHLDESKPESAALKMILHHCGDPKEM